MLQPSRETAVALGRFGVGGSQQLTGEHRGRRSFARARRADEEIGVNG